MNIADVYTKKSYTCKKCDGQVYYAKVTDDQGKIVTEDGKLPNGKFGKESNVLSGAVDANDKTKFHECYLSNLQKKYQDAIGLTKEEIPNLKMPTFQDGLVGKPDDVFEELANNAYLKLSILASKFCGAGATAKEVHITTMGLMHDYFQWKTTQQK